MSTFRMIPALILGLGLGMGNAHADKKVDWSAYLETPGERVPIKHAAVESQQPVAAATPKAKPARGKATKRPSAKRAPARGGHHR